MTKNRHKIRVSAKGFFFNLKGEVLLVEGKRPEKGEIYFCAPGGGVEEGESLKAALERELIEETGYRGVVGEIVFCQDYDNPDHSRNFEVFFIGTINENKRRVGEGDHKSKFISKEKFESTIFYPKGIDPFELRKKEGVGYKTYLHS